MVSQRFCGEDGGGGPRGTCYGTGRTGTRPPGGPEGRPAVVGPTGWLCATKAIIRARESYIYIEREREICVRASVASR